VRIGLKTKPEQQTTQLLCEANGTHARDSQTEARSLSIIISICSTETLAWEQTNNHEGPAERGFV